jgi:uracil-DNA glycosylase
MDPYYTGVATGLAFDVPKECKLPPSLINIRKEIENCGYQNTPNKGDLSGWVKQGVFLINSALTVEKGSAGGHIAMWSKFTSALLKYITRNQIIVFLMLGKKAQAYQKYLPSSQVIVATSHPSPLSANDGFLGSKCFKQVNTALLKLGKEEIDWSL